MTDSGWTSIAQGLQQQRQQQQQRREVEMVARSWIMDCL